MAWHGVDGIGLAIFSKDGQGETKVQYRHGWWSLVELTFGSWFPGGLFFDVEVLQSSAFFLFFPVFLSSTSKCRLASACFNIVLLPYQN